METYMEPAKLKDYVNNELYIHEYSKPDVNALIDYIVKDATSGEFIQIQKPEDDHIGFMRDTDVFIMIELTPWGFSARVTKSSGSPSIDLETSESVEDFLHKVDAVREIIAN